MTRLTIVMPTLNQGRYIERSIASVVAQLTSDDVFVVVDGGSEDDTHDILQRWSDRINHVEIQTGSTQSEALVWGFQQFPAEYACYLNSDDLLLPGALGAALSTLQADDRLTAVYSHRVFIDPDDKVSGIWYLPGHVDYLMARWDYIPQETCFWRYKSMMDCGGIDQTLNFAMDYDLFVGLMHAGRMRRINAYWAAFRQHDLSKTNTVNDTVGVHEVNLVQRKHGIGLSRLDRYVGGLLRRYVEYRSGLVFSRNSVKKSLACLVSSAKTG